MKDALDAIKTIKEEFAVYGSDITLRTVTQGAYDPMTGVTTTTTDTALKAIIKSEATLQTERAFTGDYESSVMFYSASEPTKTDKILIDGDTYNIVYIAKTILQNVTIKYELLISR